MAGGNSSESPLDAIADTVGERTTEAFEILANETRLAILLALWEESDPDAEQTPVSFSDLRDHVGMRDSGQFNYHLDKLVGPFVEQSEEGYSLTTRAEQVLRTVLAGTLTEPTSFEGEPIDAECYRCGSPVVVDYSDSRFFRRCTGCQGIWRSPEWPAGTLVGGYRPPAALENRTPQEWNRDCNARAHHRRASIMEGVCPDCAGTITTTINDCDDHDTDDDTVCERCGSLWEIQSKFVCNVCKFAWITPAWGPIFTETAVLSFFHDHGLDPRDLFDVAFYTAANRPIFDAIERVSVRSEEPMELEVMVELDDDRLQVTLDDEVSVIDMIEVTD